METTPPEDRISVALVDHMVLVRVDGRGSFKVSTPLKEFLYGAIDEGAHTAVIDLAQCSSMDSTFMGIIASSAGRFRRVSGSVVLVNLTPRTRALIGTLGLDRVVKAHDVGDTPEPFARFVDTAKVAKVEAPTESKQELNRTVLEAHETLVQIEPSNAPKFQNLLSILREDPARKSTGGRAG